MLENKPKLVLEIETTIRFGTKIYKMSAKDILRWLLPIAIVVVRLVARFHGGGA